MITNADRISIVEQHNNGKTFADIGREYGVSRQSIQRIYRDEVGRSYREESAAYPNLYRWMKENHVTIRDMAKDTRVHTNTITRWISHADERMPMKFIRYILARTNLPFEWVFEERSK